MSTSSAKTKTRSFWFVAYSLLIVMMGTNIPSPLYSLYGDMWGFSSGMATLLFSIYAMILVPTSLVFGQLSDQWGRKKILFIGILVACAGSLLFGLSQNVGMLLMSRAVQGLGVGVINGTAIATLAELRPENKKLAALVASVAIAIGTALGPLYAGLLAEYAPFPIRLPYYLHVLLLIPAFLGVRATPETMANTNSPKRLRMPNVPRDIRKPFLLAAFASIIAWSVAGFFMSLVPSFVAGLMDIDNLALSGAFVCLMLGCSTLSQIYLKSLPSHSAIILGFVLLMLGIAGVAIAIPIQSIWLLLVSTVLAGSGHGPAAAGSMALTNEISPPDSRADVISSYYAIAYLGVALPVLGLGFGAEWIGMYPAILAFSILIIIAALSMMHKIKKQDRQIENSR